MNDIAHLDLDALFQMRYVAVYRANAPRPEKEMVILKHSGLRVTLHPGPINFSVTVPHTVYEPPAATMTLMERQVNFPDDCYLIVECEASENKPGFGIHRSALWIAEIIAVFDLLYRDVVAEKLFAGVVNTPGTFAWVSEAPVRITAQPLFDTEHLAENIATSYTAVLALSEDIRERYSLASRWFRRGHETVSLVDKFLYWWIVLEIFPGKDVVWNTSKLLAAKVYPDKTASEIKAKIKLGRIAGLRIDIVHNGKAFVDTDKEPEFSDYLERLRATAATCLRLLLNISPGEELDKYVSINAQNDP